MVLLDGIDGLSSSNESSSSHVKSWSTVAPVTSLSFKNDAMILAVGHSNGMLRRTRVLDDGFRFLLLLNT
jgi:hypothetical protein